MTETYIERVNRFRVVRHEELPPEHKAAYRLNGIDPDNAWSLIWSFEKLEDAEAQLAIEKEHMLKYPTLAKLTTFRIIDNGEASEIKRSAWF